MQTPGGIFPPGIPLAMVPHEDFLHHVWMNRLYSNPLVGDDGSPVKVLDPGRLNRDAGPDFFNARIRIGTTIWAGNVEIHRRSSDWTRHGHEKDSAYGNVILHAVGKIDAAVHTVRGNRVTTVRLDFPEGLYRSYTGLIGSDHWVPCHDRITVVDPLIRGLWLDRLAVERLERKAADVARMFRGNRGEWTGTVYEQLFRGFGYKLNVLPFGMLAASLPYAVIRKHLAHPLLTEALLFGQAGLLSGEPLDEYQEALSQAYAGLKRKYRLEHIDPSLWKFLRLRPAGFPTVRIALLAALLQGRPGLPGDLIAWRNLRGYRALFTATASGYWDRHYVFGKASPHYPKTIGYALKNSLLINTVAPVLFMKGDLEGDERTMAAATGLLERLPPERNAVIRGWERTGLDPPDALNTQGLLQLKNNYCNFKRCLTCRIGAAIIRQAASRSGQKGTNHET